MKNRSFLLSLLLILGLLISCSSVDSNNSNKKVVCTTGIIADVVRNILPEQYEIKEIMGPGIDPHTYKSTSSDLKAFSNADVIIYNDLHLEANLIEAIHSLSTSKNVIALGSFVPESLLISTSDVATFHDPHIWHDVELFANTIEAASKVLIQAYPNDAEIIQNKTATYLNQLKTLDQTIKDILSVVPDSSRIIITAHDAFNYYGRKYKMEVNGVQGVSTASEAGLRDITNLTELITQKNIKAIFVENSVSERSIKSIIEGCESRGHLLQLGGMLYSDGLGDPNGEAGTYIKMMTTNAQTIANALKP